MEMFTLYNGKRNTAESFYPEKIGDIGYFRRYRHFRRYKYFRRYGEKNKIFCSKMKNAWLFEMMS